MLDAVRKGTPPYELVAEIELREEH
jgi:hypothetical protein